MADVLLIPGKFNRKIELPEDVIKKIPDNIILFSAVQFLHMLPEIKEQLATHGKSAKLLQSRNFLYEGMITEKGQLLGCNMENFQLKEEFDAFLYIGDGVFHPKALLVNNEKDVYCFDPKTMKLNVLDKSLHNIYQKHKKGATLKFLSSENIGILITTKAGQGSPKRAYRLKQAINKRWPDKNIYIFYANELIFSELENFNFIDVFINGACSRIGYDDVIRSEKPIINIADVEHLLKD